MRRGFKIGLVVAGLGILGAGVHHLVGDARGPERAAAFEQTNDRVPAPPKPVAEARPFKLDAGAPASPDGAEPAKAAPLRDAKEAAPVFTGKEDPVDPSDAADSLHPAGHEK